MVRGSKEHLNVLLRVRKGLILIVFAVAQEEQFLCRTSRPAPKFPVVVLNHFPLAVYATTETIPFINPGFDISIHCYPKASRNQRHG